MVCSVSPSLLQSGPPYHGFGNAIFQSLSIQQKDKVFQRMSYRTIPAGETVIKEGDEGDEMYLVDYGVFAVLKKDESVDGCGVNQEVFRYTTSGASFGELR